jgi:hypothetical protein
MRYEHCQQRPRAGLLSAWEYQVFLAQKQVGSLAAADAPAGRIIVSGRMLE